MPTFTSLKTGLIFVLLALIGFNSKAQLNAQFTASSTSGCSPLVVNFTDQSTGNPTQWRWNLGNGTISNLQNPSVTYFTPGQYTVKLVVINASGSDSIIKTQYINIFAQPVVDFSATPRDGCFPLPVQFTDLSTTNNGTNTQWQWDFGDGTFGNTQNPSHVYTAGGNYNVSLVVTNSNGCFKALTKLQYIQIASGVRAGFTNSTPTTCTPPVNINFLNTSTGIGALTYNWNFGDGSTSTQVNPSYNYATSGSYTVQLIVTNSSGCKDTLIRPNAVTIGATNTKFNAPDTACAGANIVFNNTSTPVPVSAFWNFGDGTTSTAISPTKAFLLPGSYQVKLVNIYGVCKDSITKTIVITTFPTVNFLTADTVACNAPFTVNFTNTSVGAVSYSWTFGDGGTSTQANPTHTYTTAGIYNVRLISTNIYGCSNSITKQSYIKIILPIASINNLPQLGCAPFDWTFSSAVTSSEPVTGYFWDFGDGSTSALENPTHTYGPGNYNITLIITTASGCTDTVKVNSGIKVGVKPVTGFSATPRDVCAHLDVNFTDLSTGNIDQWLWDFGDGGNSTVQNPIHIYEDTGFFHVQLIVWNNGCPDTLKIDNYIHVKPPIAKFTVATTCSDPLNRIFTDQSIGADQWDWDFGDGTTSNIPSPVHMYAASGIYIVNLTVLNFSTGCTYTTTKSVRVIAETVDFSASDTVICRNNTVSFNSIVSNPANLSFYQWSFGDGTTATGQNATHTYTVSGIYDISLITIDWNGCRDTLFKNQYIRVNGPKANFISPVVTSCLQNNITFTDSSTSDGTHPITQWIWNYGDGVIDTLSSGPFQHTYSLPGTYTVTLIVKDSNGCIDSIVKSNLLTVSKPVANFTAETLSCPGASVLFLNSSTGTGLIYRWYFGDGGFSIDANPRHVYAANGTYTVKLVIFDQYGCSDSITKPNYIIINTPVAGFNVSDSIGSCPPLIVTFTNTSQNYTSYLWDFGDGTSSNAINPSHFYNVPGVYNSKLTVSGPGGCTSMIEQKITVRGPFGTFTYTPVSGCKPLTVNFRATTYDRVSFIWDFSDGSTVATSDSIISHTYIDEDFYVPRMILIDIGGCVVPISGPDTIFVQGITSQMNFNSQTLCDAGTVQFNSSTSSNIPISGYQWNFGDGTTSTSPNPSHFYNAPGLYYPTLTVSSSLGCKDSVRSLTPVKIVSTPNAVITQTNNGCVPVTVSFNGSLNVADTSALNWQWNMGNGNMYNISSPDDQIYSVAGTYPISLFVTNSSGCVDTVLSSVKAFAIPNVSAGSDLLICQGTGKNLLATGAATYVWTPSTGLSCTNCANPLATPNVLTNYIVTGTTIEGCTNKDTITLTVKYPFVMTNSPGDSLCVGGSARLSASGALTYTWSPSTGLNNANISSPIASPTVSTTYMVIGTDDKNCFSDTAYIPIRVFNYPTVEAGPDKTLNVGHPLILTPLISSDVTNVSWSPTGTIISSNYPAVTVMPNQSTTYDVMVTNSGGCTAKDNVTVHVICNGANVFIPNTFSPNGDGNNEIFYPRGTGLFSVKSARIFNRWGEVIYEKHDFTANDASAGWDGTYKGQKLNTDVFVYMIEIVCDNNIKLVYKGNVTLIK